MTAPFTNAITLVRSKSDATDLAGFAPIATKLARGIQDILESLNGGVAITAGTANTTRYPEWRIAQNPFGVLLRFGLNNGRDEVLVHLPGYFISQIVDRHYGGCGAVPARGEFTPAELRFIARLGEQIVAALEAAGSTAATFAKAQTDILGASWPKSRDAVVVQPLTVEGGEIKPAIISVIFASECARIFSDGSACDTANAAPPDAAWATRMRMASMRMQLPARTVLAQGEVCLHRLMRLAPGDILPLMIPAQIPLTVAGSTFARGSLGEANGRAALMIEKIEKEMDQ
jgi:flagellar motor switch protein FliM